MAARHTARVLAVQGLYSWEMSRSPVGDIITFSWLTDAEREELPEETMFFARTLIMGAIERIAEVDASIQKIAARWNLDRMGKVDLAILRMSTYSILFQEDVPAAIVIDEAIRIAKKYCGGESYRFINGVLDAMKRAKGGDGKS